MFSRTADCHSIITVFDDREDQPIAKAIHRVIDGFGMRIVTPTDAQTLEQAALNSALILVGIYKNSQETFKIISNLSCHKRLAAKIVAVCLDDTEITKMELFSYGFDSRLIRDDLNHVAFSSYVLERVRKGNKRMNSVLQDEEYQRVCDALSCAPASMIIFDQDKKAVFVSDHYFRAYPRIAKRLIRGLSVYDAFDMMMKEEGIPRNDQRFKLLQDFWHNMEGRIEFTLDSGTTYSLKAVDLPRSRGTVIVGQNVSMYRNGQSASAQSSYPFGFDLLSENVAHVLHQLSDSIYGFIQSLNTKIADIDHDATNPHKVRLMVEQMKDEMLRLEEVHELLEKSLHRSNHGSSAAHGYSAAVEIPAQAD